MRMLILFCSIYFYAGSFAELDTEWWKHTIIYELIPYTFKDSNGDGIGDLKGITSKLDYFVDLGVETIHLTPIYKTTLRDMGYDISDYYGIEPRLGTMKDFEQLITEMRKRDMKLVLDLVINHSGNEHEWFHNSVDKIAPYTDFYFWRNSKDFDDETQQQIPPNNWRSIFSIDTPGSGWTWNEKRQQYYFHQFLPEQPDFDLNNVYLKKELKKMIKFWLDKGVDGFRLDATPFFFEDKEFRDDDYETRQLNQPETLEFIHELRLFLDEYNQEHGGFERVFIAEAHADVDVVVQYYDKENYPITHFPYTFMFEHFYHPIKSWHLEIYIEMWMQLLPKGKISAWMTQDHDGARVGSRITPEYGDILTVLTMMLPGTVGVYYGQEISMQNGFITQDQMKDFSGGGTRDPARLAMQWDQTTNAGFSNNISPYLPPNSDYYQRNVEVEKAKKISHYNMFKDLSTLRKTNTLKYGKFKHLAPLNQNVYILKRSHESHMLTAIVNFETSMSRINLNTILKDSTEKITVVAASINAGYSKGFTIEPDSAGGFEMRPLSVVVLETIHLRGVNDELD